MGILSLPMYVTVSSTSHSKIQSTPVLAALLKSTQGNTSIMVSSLKSLVTTGTAF